MANSTELIRELFTTAMKYPQKIAIMLDDQAWTYAELIEQIIRVVDHLHQLNIDQGQIIYQFVHRSFEMICGLFGILCAGGIYCPIDPADPVERVLSILEQLQGQYVLVHQKTHKQFPSLTTIKQVIMLEEILIPSSTIKNINNLRVRQEHDPAIILCTSGTTGKQKAVVHTFKSISTSVFGLTKWNLGLYTFQQQILQVAASSWVLHVLEIMAPLVIGGTVILLRPTGHLDMNYFAQTMIQKQVTTLTIAPALIRALTNYLEITERIETFQFVRNLCVVGEALKPKQLVKLIEISRKFHIQICNQYGLTECNAALGCQLKNTDDCIVPLGYPIPGCECLLIDEKGQIISNTNSSNEIGQIHLTGSGVFHCYLNDPERTNNMFVTIDNQIYMKTGDLARYNIRGELIPAGRIDFQIKIRGQRVEITEIENTIIEWSSNEIRNCLITKISEDDDLLIAYILSDNVDLPIEQIREYCNKKLRQYMVPSYFIVLKEFPCNPNGKIDRKRLPLPSKSHCLVMKDEQMSDLEKRIYKLWCSILRLDVVSRETNCFALGGSSLTLMQLFNYYQFHLAPSTQLNIVDFFTNPTIANHARLLTNIKAGTRTIWTPLHLKQGPVSWIQKLFLPEKITAEKSWNIANTTSSFKISHGCVSIQRLRQAMRQVVAKHAIFRTSFRTNPTTNELYQQIEELVDEGFQFVETYITTMDDVDLINNFILREKDPDLFLPQESRHIRLHIIRHRIDNDILSIGDVIIITIRHVTIDYTSLKYFLNDLALAYETGQLVVSSDALTYLDYTIYDLKIDRSASLAYWEKHQRNLDQKKFLSRFPIDHPYTSEPILYRPVHAIVSLIDKNMLDTMFEYANACDTTLATICLAGFGVFLFDLLNYWEDDFGIHYTMTRPPQQPECAHLIGPFVHFPQLRMHLENGCHTTFHSFVCYVRSIIISGLDHAEATHIYCEEKTYETCERISVQFDVCHHDHLVLDQTNNVQLDLIRNEHDGLPQDIWWRSNDFNLLFVHFWFDSQVKTLHYAIVSPTLLFERSSVENLSVRFQSVLERLFSKKSILDDRDTCTLAKLLQH